MDNPERSTMAPQKDAVPWLLESRNVNASKRDVAFDLGDFISSNIYDERATMCFVAAKELESLRVRVRLMEQLLATRIIEMRFAEGETR